MIIPVETLEFVISMFKDCRVADVARSVRDRFSGIPRSVSLYDSSFEEDLLLVHPEQDQPFGDQYSQGLKKQPE